MSNDSDNQANQPQTELVAGHETDEKSRSKQEKEGRAINFNPNSTTPGQMPASVNFVTTSTEKAHVFSFFDLSDVSMDHDHGDNANEHPEKKGVEVTTDGATAGHGIVDECSYNGTTYKASLSCLINGRIHKLRDSLT